MYQLYNHTIFVGVNLQKVTWVSWGGLLLLFLLLFMLAGRLGLSKEVVTLSTLGCLMLLSFTPWLSVLQQSMNFFELLRGLFGETGLEAALRLKQGHSMTFSDSTRLKLNIMYIHGLTTEFRVSM